MQKRLYKFALPLYQEGFTKTEKAGKKRFFSKLFVADYWMKWQQFANISLNFFLKKYRLTEAFGKTATIYNKQQTNLYGNNSKKTFQAHHTWLVQMGK